MPGTITTDLLVWGLTFALGSAFAWLAWLTIRHYSFGKKAYQKLAGDDLSDGFVEHTDKRFDTVEEGQEENREEIDKLSSKVDGVDSKVDRLILLTERDDIDKFNDVPPSSKDD
jgi:hypothetical protein